MPTSSAVVTSGAERKLRFVDLNDFRASVVIVLNV